MEVVEELLQFRERHQSRISNLGVILLAVRKSLKCLLAVVCNIYWTRERMERTAKRLLQQYRQK